MNGVVGRDGRTQVFLVHGGMTFKDREGYLQYLRTMKVSLEEKASWSSQYLKEALGDEFQVIRPRFPLREFAQYDEWKTYFERFFPLLNDDLVLVGSSLGGVFLSKYLSENSFPKRLLSVYLVAPPFDGSLSSEELAGGFELGGDLSLMEENCRHITLLFSKDDVVVPVQHAEKYREKLRGARIIVYESKNGHFLVSEFPEIVAMIKEDRERFLLGVE